MDYLRLVAMILGAGMLLYAASKGADGALIGAASLLIGFAIGRGVPVAEQVRPA